MNISGQIIKVFDPKSGVTSGGKAWKKQEFVVEVPGRYPKRICLSIFGSEKIDNAPLSVGANVSVDFDIDAREYNGRWYNDVEAWRVTAVASAQTAQQTAQAAVQQPQQASVPQPQNNAPQPSQSANNGFPPQVDANGNPTTGESTDDSLPF